MRMTHQGLRGVLYLLAMLAVLAAGIPGAPSFSKPCCVAYPACCEMPLGGHSLLTRQLIPSGRRIATPL